MDICIIPRENQAWELTGNCITNYILPVLQQKPTQEPCDQQLIATRIQKNNFVDGLYPQFRDFSSAGTCLWVPSSPLHILPCIAQRIHPSAGTQDLRPNTRFRRPARRSGQGAHHGAGDAATFVRTATHTVFQMGKTNLERHSDKTRRELNQPTKNDHRRPQKMCPKLKALNGRATSLPFMGCFH